MPREEMYVVTVLFTLDASHRKQFEMLVLKNAADSLQEPGCLRFDVCFTTDNTGYFLYEIYKSLEAFEEHLKTSHFKKFNEASQSFVKSKQIQTYLLAPNPFVHAS